MNKVLWPLLCLFVLSMPGNVYAQEASPLSGLGLGVGLALTVVSDGDEEVLEATVDANNIVRVNKTVNRQPRIVLESHYFFGLPADENRSLPPLFRWLGWLGCGTTNVCGQGPFVAIEPGSEKTIDAFALGYMVGFRRGTEGEEGAVSSWNIGIGYVAEPSVRYLGRGLRANEELPENDTIRYREESRAGWLILTSFTF